MSEYIDGENILSRRPEPGRPLYPSKPKENKQEIKVNAVDVNAIADAVIKAINNKLPTIQLQQNQQSQQNQSIQNTTFNNEDAMSKLANAMVYNKDNNESNLDGLGNIKENKKDNVDKTIDLLSQLGD